MPRWSHLGVKFKISDKHLRLIHMGVPRPFLHAIEISKVQKPCWLYGHFNLFQTSVCDLARDFKTSSELLDLLLRTVFDMTSQGTPKLHTTITYITEMFISQLALDNGSILKLLIMLTYI